ncbi:MAG: GHKL domain-containing protein [candidate division Zixibacteria bacterium]|nr:GHKL domain-containing protein [candidate division Zixibacteria bacterium]
MSAKIKPQFTMLGSLESRRRSIPMPNEVSGGDGVCRWLCAVVVAVSLLVAVPATAVERLEIDNPGDSAYLSHRFRIVYSTIPSPDQPTIPLLWQVIRPAVGDSVSGLYVSSYNTKDTDDRPSVFGLFTYPGRQLLKDTPVRGVIRDWRPLASHPDEPITVLYTSYSRDTAYVNRLAVETGQVTSVYLAHGRDERPTGNDKWEPWIDVLLVDDYDFDSTQEAFVYINSERQSNPAVRTLYCIDATTLSIEWSLPVASPIHRGDLCVSESPDDPSVLFLGYNAKQGFSDSRFTDLMAYLVKVDHDGQVIFQYDCAEHHFDGDIVSIPSHSRLYVSHVLPFPEAEPPPIGPDEYRLTAMDWEGHSLASTVLTSLPRRLWAHPFGNDSELWLCVQMKNGIIQVYDSTLTLIAQSDSVAYLDYLGRAKIAGLADSVMLCGDGVYTNDFEELADMPVHTSSIEVLGYDDQGNAQSFLINDVPAAVVALEKKSTAELIGVFYRRNQNAVLMVLTGLIVAVVIVNYYRRKSKATLEIIARQRDELRETHRALQEAQATIIAQEKYRQARDIAGGFGHEIRNALLPAENALERLRSALDKIDNGHQHNRYIASLDRAINRVFDLTDVISQYLKLDRTFAPVTFDLNNVIRETIDAQRLRLEEQGVTVNWTPSGGVCVLGDPVQIQSVVSNLLINSLDALREQPHPVITVTTTDDEHHVRVCIEDNGQGIPADEQSRIFDTFYTTKPRSGHGLGLAIVKRIVEMHGGTIEIQSDHGHHTTVEFTLNSALTQQEASQ